MGICLVTDWTPEQRRTVQLECTPHNPKVYRVIGHEEILADECLAVRSFARGEWAHAAIMAGRQAGQAANGRCRKTQKNNTDGRSWKTPKNTTGIDNTIFVGYLTEPTLLCKFEEPIISVMRLNFWV